MVDQMYCMNRMMPPFPLIVRQQSRKLTKGQTKKGQTKLAEPGPAERPDLKAQKGSEDEKRVQTKTRLGAVIVSIDLRQALDHLFRDSGC